MAPYYFNKSPLTSARLSGISQNSFRPEVSEDAGLAVDTIGEMLALFTHATPLHVAVDVQGLAVAVHLLVVVALVRVAVAVARLALVRVFPNK